MRDDKDLKLTLQYSKLGIFFMFLETNINIAVLQKPPVD